MRPSRWTKELDDKLKLYKESGAPWKMISEKLGFGESSCQARYKKIKDGTIVYRELPALQKKPGVGTFTLEDLKPNQCRWPHGDRPPYTFCGADISHKSYCAHHQFIALQGDLSGYTVGNQLPEPALKKSR